MVLAVGQLLHRQHSAVLSTVVKATVVSVESVAVRWADPVVQRRHLKLNSDSENETVAAK